MKRVFYSVLNAGSHLTLLLRDQKLCDSGHHHTGSAEDAEAVNVGVRGGQDPFK